ncbi:Uncharacterised protein [Mycobacterium tuberculosis]|uniref:Uncharacterized protein n=1 Tax=Mycobacterium tuberculosis TaxID=1773 RepID=A0A916LAA7_MYCTX|nr:Uncharacterised protein [Mycobacterium tuberculosis]COX81608.1 Uncharacterised protein [Mycobacterium tuberculosis]
MHTARGGPTPVPRRATASRSCRGSEQRSMIPAPARRPTGPTGRNAQAPNATQRCSPPHRCRALVSSPAGHRWWRRSRVRPRQRPSPVSCPEPRSPRRAIVVPGSVSGGRARTPGRPRGAPARDPPVTPTRRTGGCDDPKKPGRRRDPTCTCSWTSARPSEKLTIQSKPSAVSHIGDYHRH